MKQNERIVVTRPSRKPGPVAGHTDILRGCGWEFESWAEGKALHVLALRSQAETRVATYAPGEWFDVVFERAVTA